MGIDDAGVHDSFFDLGGYSMQATMLVSRLRERFRIDLPLRTLFKAPTIAGLAREIADVRGSDMRVSANPIVPMPRTARLPLTFAQERIWFIDQIAPGNVAYNDTMGLALDGDLDPRLLELSLAEVVRRHEILRTSFPDAGGSPNQEIHAAITLPLELIDLSEVEGEEREQAVRDLAVASGQRPFDLQRGPLLRTSLLRLSQRRHVLLLTIHHIVSDGWSLGVMINEVAQIYRAMIAGRPSHLPPLAIQYADFAQWQREWLRDARLETLLAYWRERLAGAPHVLELPLDHPRSPEERFMGSVEEIDIDESVTSAFRMLARSNDVTLFMALLAAFKTLILRYTGSDDVIVGTDVANRNRRETEPLIGFFTNQLVLRTDISGDPTFIELLSRVREVTLGAYDHQDLPFSRLVEELQPQRDLSRNPLFQIAFTLQDAPPLHLDLDDLRWHHLSFDTGISRVDFEFNLHETPRGITGRAVYNSDLFKPATIRRMLEQYALLLREISERPAQRLSSFSLLSESERHLQLVTWNAAGSSSVSDATFHRCFEERAALHPEQTAVVHGDRRMSYRALNEEANRLARVLLAEGIGLDQVVGLLMERGIEMLTTMLALFKIGAAYLPLDPGHPSRRRGGIIEGSGMNHLIVAPELAGTALENLEEVPEELRPGIVCVADLDLRGSEAGNLDIDYPPEALAYVIYTSGSTGRSKGAMVEHRGLLNHIRAKIADLELSDADAVAQTASQCFDISVWQFLAVLLVGGHVVIYDDDITHRPGMLLDDVEGDGVTIWEMVPSYLGLVIEEIDRRGSSAPALRSLRWLVPTGEALPPHLCGLWLERYPCVPMLNAYGPTECSDDVTHYPIAASPEPGVSRMPIGRPVINTQIYILDEHLQPVPLRGMGEL